MPLPENFWDDSPEPSPLPAAPPQGMFRWVRSLLTPHDTVALGKLPSVAHVVSCQAIPPRVKMPVFRYLVKTAARGEWAGHDGEFATWHESGWIFVKAILGMACIVDDPGLVLIYQRTNP